MTLAARCSSSHLCTPTARTEGCSGAGEIPTAPFPAGVPEGTGVSSALISADGEHKTSPQKPTKKNKRRFGHCCFIATLRSLSLWSYLFSGLTLKAATNKEKFLPSP